MFDWTEKYGWVIVSLALLMLLAQLIRYFVM